jgi:hypothetical protein
MWSEIKVQNKEWLWIDRVVAFLECLAASETIQTPSLIHNGIREPTGYSTYIAGTISHDTKCTPKSNGNQICHLYQMHPCKCYYFMGQTGYYFPLNAVDLNDHLYLTKGGKIQSRNSRKRNLRESNMCYCDKKSS